MAWTCALAMAACAGAPPLQHTYASAPALAEALLQALHRRDRPALEALALDAREFRDHVWPYLPAARPERNLPLSYVWEDLHQKSTEALTAALARQGGRCFRLTAVRFAGRTDYGGYRIHRRAVLRVDDGTGAVADLRICGSMIEQGGRWKVFSYVVE